MASTGQKIGAMPVTIHTLFLEGEVQSGGDALVEASPYLGRYQPLESWQARIQRRTGCIWFISMWRYGLGSESMSYLWRSRGSGRS